MELKPGLHRTGALDVEATRRQAEEEGFTTFVLPAVGIVDRPSFFDAVRTTFPLEPLLPGHRSWDSLSDSLFEGLYTHTAQRFLILWPGTHAMATSALSDFEIAVDVLAQVARLLADPNPTCGITKEVVILVE